MRNGRFFSFRFFLSVLSKIVFIYITSERPCDPFPIPAQFLFVAFVHEFPDICKEFLFLFGDAAFHMEKVRCVFVHEDRVIGKTAHKLMDLLQLFRFGGFGVNPLFHCTIQRRSRNNGQHGGVHHCHVQTVIKLCGAVCIFRTVSAMN